VHCGQRVAFSGISEQQKGHARVVGAAAGAGFVVHRFTIRTNRYTAIATIRNSITVFRKIP
jgi:hypothetical protein